MYPVVRLWVPDQGECQGPQGPGQCLAPPLGAAALDFNVQLHVIVLFHIYPLMELQRDLLLILLDQQLGNSSVTPVLIARGALLSEGARCRY